MRTWREAAEWEFRKNQNGRALESCIDIVHQISGLGGFEMFYLLCQNIERCN